MSPKREQEAVGLLPSKALSPQKRQGESPNQLLIEALDDLAVKIAAKIDADVEAVARAFWSAHEFEEKGAGQGSLLTLLTHIGEASAKFGSAKEQEIIAVLNGAGSPLELSLMLASMGALEKANGASGVADHQPLDVDRARTMIEVAGMYTAEQDYVTTVMMYLLGFGDLNSPKRICPTERDLAVGR